MRIERHCPVCAESPRLSPRVLLDHETSELFKVADCDGCECAYVIDPPSPKDIGDYYEPVSEIMREPPGALFQKLQGILLQRDVGPMIRLAGNNAHYLDVGAGDGAMSRYLSRRGLEVVAADALPAEKWTQPSIPYYQIDLNGLLNQTGEWRERLKDGRPIAVIMRHVLEHLYEPAEALQFFRELGVRWVTLIVPNYRSWMRPLMGDAWFYWDPPRHLTHFSPHSLEALAKRAGYRPLKIKTYGLDEVVGSFYRYSRLKKRSVGERWINPRGPLVGLSAAGSHPFLNTAIWGLFELAR